MNNLAKQANAAAGVPRRSDRKAAFDALQGPICPSSPQRRDVVAAGGDADYPDTGAVACADVAGSVANRDAGAVGEGTTGDELGPAQSRLRHLCSVG